MNERPKHGALKLTEEHLKILGRASELVDWATASDLFSTPQKIAPLVRFGYLCSVDDSSQSRGERRIYWKLYELTPLGRAEVLSRRG